jgi:hypothetical protein
MIEKVRLWGDSAFGMGGTRKRSLRVSSPVARLDDCLFSAKQNEPVMTNESNHRNENQKR